MAKKLIPRNMRKSLKKTIKSQGGQTSDPEYKGRNDARKQIRGKVNSGEMKRKSVTWNFKVGDLVKIKNYDKRDKSVRVAVVLKKITKTNQYANEDREYVTVATPENSHYEIDPKRLTVIQRMSK